MATNLMNSPFDKRRSKHRQRKQTVDLAQIYGIVDDAENRPASLYDVDQIVKTPIGYRHVSMAYHSFDRGWRYTVYSWRYGMQYSESEIQPLYVEEGDEILLQSGVRLPVHRIYLTNKKVPMVVLKVRGNQYTVYPYEDLLKLNPPSKLKALQAMQHAILDGRVSENHALELCRMALSG